MNFKKLISDIDRIPSIKDDTGLIPEHSVVRIKLSKPTTLKKFPF